MLSKRGQKNIVKGQTSMVHSEASIQVKKMVRLSLRKQLTFHDGGT